MRWPTGRRTGSARRCGARPRAINYEILGNGLPCLHAHVFPRYAWEPEERRKGPVWLYPPEELYAPAHALSDAHDGLRTSIADALDQVADPR